ncbi:DedA family protein [Amycolatopsis sp. NPDC059021]|uniref:DedA family protein n=1 Tax=Amycolatopsis sp. NPDC059021 TaxID=3346704 RepID=UPI00366BA3A2
MHIDQWLEAIPPLSVYLIVGLVIMIESLGIPLPGEVVLISAALLSSQHSQLSPVWIAILASAGAIIGDSIGYTIGRKGGTRLLAWAGRKFPKHFGPDHIANAERMFQKRGAWAVFFGRFVAFLRILAGPLAGSLGMHYPRFLMANAAGGIVWAAGTTTLIYYLGVVAEKWLKNFSYVGLGVAVLFGLVFMLVIKKRMARKHHDGSEAPSEKDSTATEQSKA